MIKVWTDAAEVGLLDRHGTRGSSFVFCRILRARRLGGVLDEGLKPDFVSSNDSRQSARNAVACEMGRSSTKSR